MSTDDRTLDEIYKDDTEMLMHKITHESKRFEFQKFTQARIFQRHMIDAALKRMGVPPIQQMKFSRQVITEQPVEIAKCNVKVENRSYPHQDRWKAGVYIYRTNADGSHGDIAYWVSDVFSIKENPILRGNVMSMRRGSKDNTGAYFVMSNVPTDDVQKHHMMIPMFG